MVNKIILLSLLAMSLLAISACNEVEDVVNDDNDFYEEDFLELKDPYANYGGGFVDFHVTVVKPTPCHEVSYTYNISDDNILEVLLELRQTDDLCAQVITPELVEGQIDVDEEPNEVNFILSKGNT